MNFHKSLRRSSISSASSPDAAEDVVAIPSAEGLDFPRNMLDTSRLSSIGATLVLQIPDVAAGTYRLLVVSGRV
jgi:hypothetical protein